MIFRQLQAKITTFCPLSPALFMGTSPNFHWC